MKRTYIALMALALVAAACGTAEPTATTAGPAPVTNAAPAPATTADPAPSTSTVGPVDTTDEPSNSPIATSDVIVAGEPIALSPTHYVVDVESDDVLNGRYGPGVGYSVNAELDPAYGTVRVKGSTQQLESGSVWASVAYSPDTQLVDEPAPYGYGWVNSHFLAPIDGWVPSGGECDLTSGIDDIEGDGASTADEIYDVIAVDLGDCVRIVVTFAENANGDHLGAVLPPIGATPIDQARLRVSVPVETVLPHATDIFASDYAGLVTSRRLPIGTDVSNPDAGLWIDFALPGAASVRGIAETGQLIIDLEKGDVSEIFVRDGTIVALPPFQTPSTFVFVGYARPFEATMSVHVEGWQGDAVFPASVSGPSATHDGAALMTTGWIESWGIYEFRVEGLSPGEYQVIVADDTAVEQDFPVVRFRITVP